MKYKERFSNRICSLIVSVCVHCTVVSLREGEFIECRQSNTGGFLSRLLDPQPVVHRGVPLQDAGDQVDLLQHRGQGRADTAPAPRRKLSLWRLSSENGASEFLVLNAFKVRSSRIPLPQTLPDEAPLWSADLKSATTFGQVATNAIFGQVGLPQMQLLVLLARMQLLVVLPPMQLFGQV